MAVSNIPSYKYTSVTSPAANSIITLFTGNSLLGQVEAYPANISASVAVYTSGTLGPVNNMILQLNGVPGDRVLTGDSAVPYFTSLYANWLVPSAADQPLVLTVKFLSTALLTTYSFNSPYYDVF